MILPPLCSAFDKSRLFAYNVRTLSIKEMIAKNMLKEFKEFAMRGNIMDLAVGVIIGGSFQKIVTSLVNDMIMPIISVFTGKIDFSTLAFQIGDVSIKYGAFLTTILDFLIIAFSIFLFVRYINKLNKKWEKMKEEELKKLEKKGKLFDEYYKRELVSREILIKVLPKNYRWKKFLTRREIKMLKEEINKK